MNNATARVLDDMILGAHAKALLARLDAGMIPMLCIAYKRIGGAKMLDELEPGFVEALAQEMNLVRYALASCDVAHQRQEELVAQTVRRVATIFVGYLDKLSKGEPIDDEHAEFISSAAAVEAASTVGDKLRAFAAMLDKRESPKAKDSSDALNRMRGKFHA